jgi:guanyl-specific ribonuclease Sa
MAAPDNAKLQANFKWQKDGSMINVYANNQAEFEQLLTAIQDTAALFFSVEQTLQGMSRLTVTAAPQAPQVAAPQAAAPVAEAAQGRNCPHGAMKFIKGVNAKGPWSGYKCALPDGTPGKCQTVFNRG